MCIAQEADPLEKDTQNLKYQLKSFPIDTTQNHYISKVNTIIKYRDGSWESLYTKYYEIFDRKTGKLVNRIDVRAVMSQLGYGIVDGSDRSKVLPVEAANDEFLLLGGGQFLIAVNILDGSIKYHHSNKNDSLYPVVATDQYFFTRGSLDFGKQDDTFKSIIGSVVLDNHFNEILRATYNEEKARWPIEIGKDLFQIPFKNGSMQIDAQKLLSLSYQTLDHVIIGNTIVIGNGAIRIVDHGWFDVQIMPSFTRHEFLAENSTWQILSDTIPDGEYLIRDGSNFFPRYSVIEVKGNRIISLTKGSGQELPSLQKNIPIRFNLETLQKNTVRLKANKWTGLFEGTLPDGDYNVKWSDYLPVNEVVKIRNSKLIIDPPYFRKTTHGSKVVFEYQGFNNSHSALTGTHGLKIIFSQP